MMKCKIVHNEGFLLVLLLITIITVDCSDLSSFSNIQELCSSNRYIYTIKPGEPQELKLTYNTTVKEIDKWYRKSKRKCRIEFKTINGAYHFVLVVANMSIPSCSEKCQCNYFEIAEPGNIAKFCGENKEPIYFESKSDYLSIDFYHGNTMPFGATLTFSVERNAYIITGLPKDEPFHSGHFIESPYFPNSYPADYVAEYEFHANTPDGRVMLLFLDFQIPPTSYIEVVGHNQTLPDRIYGREFRPPVFVSQQTDLTLRFDANSQPGNSGFRAVSYFVKSSDVQISKPFTDCGGSEFGYGGSLNLESAENRLYDCLWHIITPIFSELTSHLLTVSNISLVNTGPNVSLEFREGRNSKSKIVKTIECADVNCSSIPYEVTVSAYNGLYIRFIGRLKQLSSVGMVYTTYHIGNCSSELPYCQGRCLPPILLCDGVEHCPDGSDELECTTKTAEMTTTDAPPVVKKKFSSTKTGTAFYVILAFGICGLIVTASALFLLVYKGVKTVPPDEHDGQQEVVTEMSEPPVRTYSVSTTVDNLPTYDDFIQAADRYPPLLYMRAAKRYSEPPYPARTNIVHTTSFCKVPGRDTPSSNSTSSEENMFFDQLPITPEPSCSYERSSIDGNFNKLRSQTPTIKRAWLSDSKLDQLGNCDCHLHLSITHCPSPLCDCSFKQYYSLPINFKINNCKSNDINIILPNNAVPKINFGRDRPLSFCHNSDTRSKSKVVTIKTRCHSDPCQFSVQCAVYP